MNQSIHVPTLRGLSNVSTTLMMFTSTQTCLLFPVCFYVAFRTPNPDEETLADMKKDLRRNGLDFNQLVKWENKYC
jgi:hypothetical protein